MINFDDVEWVNFNKNLKLFILFSNLGLEPIKTEFHRKLFNSLENIFNKILNTLNFK